MLKELKANHRNIIQMSFNGFKNNEIAEKLGMSPGTISSILRSPLGKAYLDGLVDKSQETTLDVRKKLISMNEAALNALDRILDPKVKAPYNVQLTAAKDVLDRNGYKPSDKIDVNMMMHKSDAELESEIAAMEAAMARNQFKQVEESSQELASPKSDSCSEPLTPDFLLVNQEVDPFLLDESASNDCPDMFERPESSLAASISQTSLEVSASTNPAISTNPSINIHKDIGINSYKNPVMSNVVKKCEVLPPDIQAKLDDESFDPFKNI